jgi:hypothetical protein
MREDRQRLVLEAKLQKEKRGVKRGAGCAHMELRRRKTPNQARKRPSA